MDDWFEEGRAGGGVDAVALLDTAGEQLAEIVALGALVSCSLTRDGGALGVTITVDGNWRREYFRDGAELADWLDSARAPVSAALDRVAASRAAGNRSRRSRGL